MSIIFYVSRLSNSAVAKKYLVEDSLTVAELDPQPIDPNKPKFAPTFVR